MNSAAIVSQGNELPNVPQTLNTYFLTAFSNYKARTTQELYKH